MLIKRHCNRKVRAFAMALRARKVYGAFEKRARRIGIWRLIDVGFCGGRKTGELEEKPSVQGESQQQTQPRWHLAGIKRGPRWWETKALTIAPEPCSLICLPFGQTVDKLVSPCKW